MMIATLSDTTRRRAERRINQERPAYLNPEVLNRIVTNAEKRILVRVRKQRGE